MKPVTSSDPYHAGPAGGDRTWGRDPVVWGRVAAVIVLVVLAALAVFDVAPLWFVAVLAALFALVLVHSLREVNRVTLRRDGTLDLLRPIGTVRIRVDQVRALRTPWYDEGESAIRMVTDQGTYLIWRELGDVRDLADALRERNPRIERRGV